MSKKHAAPLACEQALGGGVACGALQDGAHDFADSRRMPCLGLGDFSCASSVSSSPFRFGVRLLGQRESAPRAANLRHELEHLRGVYRAPLRILFGG